MPVYLDNNATTPLDERVLEAMLPYMQDVYGNPSSVHRFGRLTRGAIEMAREQVAALVGAHASQVTFTASGTEANNLAIYGTARSMQPAHALISAIEHPSLREPAFALRDEGWQVDEIPVDDQCCIHSEALTEVLQTETRLVSIMLANNETGVLQNIKSITNSLGSDIVMHTDVSQAAGKVKIDFAALGAQLITLSSHKLHGPLGAGALIQDKAVSLKPMLLGGDHERNLRAGTENVAAIVGFGKAAELALAELGQRTQHTRLLRERLEKGLNKISQVVVFAEEAERLPNTVQFGIEGCHGETLLMQLDKEGFAVSSGSACHSQVNEPSHVLTAMGVERDLALTAVRVSIGKQNNEEEIDRFIAVIENFKQEFIDRAPQVA